VDSPTLYGHDTGAGGEVVGNYATANPLDTRATALTYRNGNLTLVGATSNGHTRSTIGPTSGKWYWEITCLSTSPNFHHGVSSGPVQNALTGADFLGAYANEWAYWPNTAGTNTAYWRTNGTGPVYGDLPRAAQNDILIFALDIDNGKIYAGLNGVWFKSGNPAAGTNALSTNIPTNGTPVFPHFMQYDNGGVSLNFGQRAWVYTPPAGFSALTTKNFARLTNAAAIAPNQFFDAVTYAGNSSTQTISTLNFQPDLIWIKSRSNSYSHWIGDAVRGYSVRLYSDGTAAEASNPSGGVTAVSSTGFTVSAGAETNNTSNNYVAWCWRAGNGTVSNTAGTITSTVSANTASGFSVVTYTGTGTTTATIGHGLGVAPAMVITKVRNAVDTWRVWHQGLFQGIDGTGHFLALNSTQIAQYDSQRCTGGDANTFRIIGNAVPYINGTGNTYVAYVWAEIAGFSKFGTYTANGSSDGPFIYCGFKPRFILLKASSSTSQWVLIDTARDTYNSTVGASGIFANASSLEETGNTSEIFDILSNGFKLRSNGRVNVSGVTHIFAAFADKPFGNANGTAR
jgi:hypothetical protein